MSNYDVLAWAGCITPVVEEIKADHYAGKHDGAPYPGCVAASCRKQRSKS